MLVSDWHTAPEAERRKVRHLAAIVVGVALFDIAFWMLFL